MPLNTGIPIIVIGTGHHFQRNLAPALKKLIAEKRIRLLATVDIFARGEKSELEFGNHFKRNNEPIHKQLKEFKKENPLVILGHTNRLHAKDAFDLLSHGFDVIVEKPYALTQTSLTKFINARGNNRCALLEYYLTMKSAPLLLGYGALKKHSFYVKESFIKPLPALKKFANSVDEFNNALPKLIGSIHRVELEVLEGEGETGTVEGRGVDTVDIKSGGGMIQDMGTHAFAPLIALEKIIGKLPANDGFVVRTARCQEYMRMAKRRFALPVNRIGETYVEITCVTDKKIDIVTRFGKYVFGDRNRRGVRIIGSHGEAYLDMNSCTLYVNGEAVLGITKNYYPVIRAAIEEIKNAPLFKFNVLDVAVRAQELVFNTQRLAKKNKQDVFYVSGSDPSDIFPINQHETSERLLDEDFRPTSNYDRWLELISKELPSFFPHKRRITITCPGCDSNDIESEFIKLGFVYKWCTHCFSLYVSPRPSKKELNNFYKNSKAMEFYAQNVFQLTLEKRNEYQIFPLAAWMEKIIQKHIPAPKHILDFKPKFYSIWTTLLTSYKKKISLVDPIHLHKTPVPAEITSPTQAKKHTYDIITAFDYLDSAGNPRETIRDFSKMCNKGGFLFMTLNTGSGFEYQLLSQDANRLTPPDRINLLTIEVVEHMLVENGFELIDISTPGNFDVDTVLKLHHGDSLMPMTRFFSYILKKRGESTRESLQKFLQLNNLSAHLRIAARKN